MITAHDILIVDVENLKIKSHCNALVSMMEKGFFDSSGDEDGKRLLKRMYEERDTKQKIRRIQEI